MLAKVIGQRVTFGAGDPGERVSEFQFELVEFGLAFGVVRGLNSRWRDN
jgi:hypothetical protein